MKDEDEEKIDAILRREYDLGFLLDYLDDRKNNPKKQGGHEKPYWLPIADILRFIPEFNREVEGIRLKYQIKPEQMKRDLMKAIGKNACNRYFTVSREFARGKLFPDLNASDKLHAIEKKINSWESKKLKTILREIGRLRLIKLKKLNAIWHKAIKNYVLYEEITPGFVLFRKQPPRMSIQVEPNTLEPYLEIKIYSHTSLANTGKRGWPNMLKQIQKKFPNYFDANRQDEETFLNRYFYFVLKKHMGLTHKDTIKWMKDKGLWGFEQNKSSREIKRFMQLFTDTSN